MGLRPGTPALTIRFPRGRAARPGHGRGRTAVAAGALVLLASACGSHPADPYAGGKFSPKFPTFLPARTLDANDDRVLTGTGTKPALTVEGEAVEIKTADWSVRVVVSGPVVPGEGLPYQPRDTTCTWTVTMSGATGRVPVSLADFNSVDHLGRVYRLTFVQGQPVPPSTLTPGRHASFELRAYEAVGEGVIRWAPVDRRIVAMWDYEVEND
jgi:hypothetical protein